MAKSVGIYGDWSGKIGNIIGYRIHNSNNDITQGLRAYNPNVYNPKTLEQARQRIKVTAAVRFYKAFREFLSISYQGKKNGHACYCEQQRLALTASLSDIPMLPRGADYFVPARYIVATGTLAPRSVVEVSPSGLSSSFVTNLVLPAPLEASQSFGTFSSSLIQSNDGLADGDTIHFIAAYETSLGRFAPWYASFQLDTTSTTPLASLGVLFASLLTVPVDGGLYRLAVNLRAAAARSSRCGGAAVAVSRGDGSTQSATLWSTATMAVASFVVQSYFYDAAYASAILTYLPAPVPASPLTLNQGGTKPKPAPVTPPPYDAELQYITFNTNQYFITDIVPDTNTGMSATFMYTGTSDVALMGCGFSDTAGTHRVGLAVAASFRSYVWWDTYKVLWQSSVKNYRAQIFLNYLNNRYARLIFSSVNTTSSNLPSLPFTPHDRLYIGCCYYNRKITQLWQGRIYEVTITQGDTIVAHFIPVRKDGVGYFFDTVAKKLHENKGSRPFALGPDKTSTQNSPLNAQAADGAQLFSPDPANDHTMAYDGSPLPLHPAVLDTEMPTTDPLPYDETI